MGSIYPKPCNL